jgi:plastocyanin
VKRSLLVALVLLVASLPSPAAQARGVTITVDNMAFTPPVVTVAQGTRVTWVFSDLVAHTTTSNQRFWASPPQLNESFGFVLPSAGSFGYHCSIHPEMTGTVRVTIRVISIPAGKRVQWSSAASPSRNYDVQIKRPGTTKWVFFRKATTALAKNFKPAVKGKYFFRARTRNLANGKASGWSPARAVRFAA